MKKLAAVLVSLTMLTAGFAGCNSQNSNTQSGAASFDATGEVTVVSREEGSGTRDAFVELTGVMTKDDKGNKTDNTTKEASVIDGTQAVMTTVSGDSYAIGYISLGSLNDTVKALKVNGVEATADNVKSGDYALQRPFNIVTKKSGVSEVAQDFIDYILSTEGQEVVSGEGYVSLDNTKSYKSKKLSGKIAISGSSSVSPVMEKLKEAYLSLNSGVTIEIQTTDSTSGINDATDGKSDIGMASRDLKDDEPNALNATKIALDGIAVIVNKANTTDDLTTEQIKKIYTGEVTAWNQF